MAQEQAVQAQNESGLTDPYALDSDCKQIQADMNSLKSDAVPSSLSSSDATSLSAGESEVPVALADCFYGTQGAASYAYYADRSGSDFNVVLSDFTPVNNDLP